MNSNSNLRSPNIPTNNEDDIGADDEGLAAVDVTEFSVLFTKRNRLAAVYRRAPSSTHQGLGGRSGKGKAGDQPARVPQVVELGCDDGMRGEEDGPVGVRDKDACSFISILTDS